MNKARRVVPCNEVEPRLVPTINLLAQFREDKTRDGYAKQFERLNYRDLQDGTEELVQETYWLKKDGDQSYTSYVIVDVDEFMVEKIIRAIETDVQYPSQILESLYIDSSVGVLDIDIDNGTVFVVNGKVALILIEDVCIVNAAMKEVLDEISI